MEAALAVISSCTVLWQVEAQVSHALARPGGRVAGLAPALEVGMGADATERGAMLHGAEARPG